MAATASTLSTQHVNSNAGSASSVATQRRVTGSRHTFASMMRRMPNDRASCTCHPVASVIPHAPASSSCFQSCGAIVVLPCGASSSPRSDVQAAIVATLCAIAARSSVSSGVAKSLRRGSVARNSCSVIPHELGGNDFSCGDSSMAQR